MSIRGLWIISSERTDTKLLYSRRFPVVEKKEFILCRDSKGKNRKYQPLPDDEEISFAILRELGINTDLTVFNDKRDSCKRIIQGPVREINGKIWPVVVYEKVFYDDQNRLIFACLPLVDNLEESRPPLITIPGVSIGLSLLDSLAKVLSSVAPSSITLNHPKLAELNDFIVTGLPFGTPIDINPTTATTQAKFTPSINTKRRQPAWRPSVAAPKSKNQLSLLITEEIRAAIYNKADISDIWDLYGSIECKADFDGKPDMTIALSVSPKSPPLTNIQTHSCVYLNESDEDIQRRKISFSPPLEMFRLCSYVSPMPSLPIKGIYEMKGDPMVHIYVNLKLTDSLTNSFEYCEVRMPIFNRGTIAKTEISPGSSNVGSVTLSQDKKTVIWAIGTKFPRNLEAKLNVDVLFARKPEIKSKVDDLICVGRTAYAQLRFKITGYTFSGCQIDPHSISVTPNMQFKPNCVSEFVSSEYRIWNSLGNAPIALTQQLQSEVTEKKFTSLN